MGRRTIFSDFDESFRHSVKLGNNSSMVVTGKGNVRLQVNRIIQIITGVFYVPELKNNVLSIGKLQAKGLIILFQNGTCKVFHPERGLIMETKMSLNRMFVLHATSQPLASTYFNTIIEDIEQLWHCRYGRIKDSSAKEEVDGLPQLKSPLRLCKNCLVVSNKGTRFQKGAHGEFHKFSNWCMLIFVDRSNPSQTVRKGT